MVGKLVEEPSGRVLVDRIVRASGPLGRSIGLLGRSHLDPGEGMWFDLASAIHTLGMSMAIDVVFLDERGNVLKVAEEVKPWCAFIAAKGARNVVELAAGVCKSMGIAPGMQLSMQWQSSGSS